MQHSLVRWLSIWLSLTTAWISTAQTATPPGAVVPALRITILEGEGALNNIKQRTAREPIVRVEDKNHKPVAGALVLFSAPRNGPSGLFENGALTQTVVTDQAGVARATGFRPNGEAGAFVIAVVATLANLKAEASIRQTNVRSPEGPTKQAKHGGHGLAPKWIVVGTVVAAGAAAGIATAVNSGGGSPRAITITPGAGTVGAPR